MTKKLVVIQATFLSLLSIVFASCVDQNVCGNKMVEKNNLCTLPENGESVDNIAVKVRIPEIFDGVPVLLAVTFFDNPTMSGIPAGFGSQIANPVFEAGDVFQFVSSHGGLDGQYYLSIVLYCEGGGEAKGPVAGIDWVSAMSVPVLLGQGTGTINTGEISLDLFVYSQNDSDSQ